MRLFPAYWLALVATLVIAALAGGFVAPSTSDLLVHATALQMPARLLDFHLAVGFGANGPLWMLSVIVGFYVLLPLVARPYLRHPLVGLALAAAVSVAWKLAAAELGGLWTGLEGGGSEAWVAELVAVDQLPAWTFSFALGMTGAWAYMRWRERRPEGQLERPALLVLGLGLVAFAACAYAFGRQAASINVEFAGSYARENELLGLAYSTARALVIAAIVVGPLWLQRPFASRPSRSLADLSYGLYLIHFPVAIGICAALLELPADGAPLSVATWFAIVLTVSIAYAYVTRRYFERPLIARWPSLRAREPGPPATPGSLAAGTPVGRQ